MSINSPWSELCDITAGKSLHSVLTMDLTTANLAVKVAIEKAEEMGGKFSIAVLDGGVNLVAFSRMDGGRVGTIDVAMKKV